MNTFAKRTSRHAAAFGLAAVLTLAMLVGIDTQATSPAPEALIAQVLGDRPGLVADLSCPATMPAEHG